MFLFSLLLLLLSIADRSTTKAKTFDPSWNEIFIHEVNNAKNIGLTVFHDAAIPPDDFVANCTIPFEDLAHRDKESQDFWVSVNFLSDPPIQWTWTCQLFSIATPELNLDMANVSEFFNLIKMDIAFEISAFFFSRLIIRHIKSK